MKKNIIKLGTLLVVASLWNQNAVAQHGFGTNLPNKASAVEIKSENKGLLIPRVRLTSLSDIDPIKSTVTDTEINSLLVFNITEDPSKNLSQGYYYWTTNGTTGTWNRLATGNSAQTEPWFVQNSSNEATLNTQNIYQMGSVALGKNTVDSPNTTLQVVGAVRGGSNTAPITNVGVNSAAFGVDNVVSGNYGFAAGANNQVLSEGSFAMGTENSIADNNQAASLGWTNSISEESNNSIAIGLENTFIEAEESYSIGIRNTIEESQRTKIVGNNNTIVRAHGATVLGDGHRITDASIGSMIAGESNTFNTSGVSYMFGYGNNFEETTWSTTLGHNNNAINSSYVHIFGNSNSVEDVERGIIIGDNNHALANRTNVLGSDLASYTYKETVLGTFNAPVGSGATATPNKETWVGTDGLLSIGNGTSPQNSSNALTILKNGNIGTDIAIAPTERLDIGSGNVRVRDINSVAGAATDKVVVADATGVLKTITTSTLKSPEPWYDQATNTEATSNTQNIYQSGSVAIGATTIPSLVVDSNDITSTVKLHVNGNISTTGKLFTTNSTYADYVFEKYFTGKSDINENYEFKTLNDVKDFIEMNHHLPGVTKISDLNKTSEGYTFDMTELSIQQLEKIEELYIHTIEQQQLIEKQQVELNELKDKLERFEKLLLEKQ